MTNKEKYLKDGVDIYRLAEEISRYMYDNESPAEETFLDNDELLAMFFEEKVKPTLTEDERVILRNIDKEYRYIHRGATGEVHLYLSDKEWDNGNFDYRTGNLIDFCEFDHLFQFIKNGEEYSIEELLK